MTDPIDFMLTFTGADLPADVRAQTHLALLDSIGIAAAGRRTELSRIIYAMTQEEYAGTLPLPFTQTTDHRVTAAGYALALGMTTDAVDGHDGFNLAKGHIGAPLYPALLAAAQDATLCPDMPSGSDFITALALGYEFGARCSIAQHATTCDFHTSGSWGAVTAAAAICRLAHLSPQITRHALGIAEYHGPRSQMMRVIDHPTMLKDGAGWGSMTGVLSVKLALKGFTGAPAITVEDAPDYWADLGSRWYGREQYYKPYPVCRWAQPPIEAALEAQRILGLDHTHIAKIEIETFHESLRLATVTPQLSDEAQYSTAFPVALALIHGTVGPQHIADHAIQDPIAQALAQKIVIRESDHANAAFPARRLARVTLHTDNGHHVTSAWQEPRWDHTNPPSAAELRQKFDDIATASIGSKSAKHIETAIDAIELGGLPPLYQALSCDPLPFA